MEVLTIHDFLQDPKHPKCHRYPCKFYKSITFLAETKVQSLVGVNEGNVITIPVMITNSDEGSLIFKPLLEVPSMEFKQIIALSDNRIVTLEGNFEYDLENNIITLRKTHIVNTDLTTKEVLEVQIKK